MTERASMIQSEENILYKLMDDCWKIVLLQHVVDLVIWACHLIVAETYQN